MLMDFALKKIQDTIQANFRKIGGGAKFFSSASKKGESAELQADLNSNDRERQKNAVKRVIATMTLGRDVSQLFTDVVKLGQTQNIELKKLVYLYILNTAKLQPEKALLAVNTFLLDTTHASPIVQGLALRTMLCLRTDTVLEYCIAPIRAALTSSEPYVRKTAALCVGKLYHQSPKSVEDQGLVASLQLLLTDAFPIVASNAAAVLAELQQCGVNITLSGAQASAVLHTLGDAGEWGRVYILELLISYKPGADEADNMIERVTPHLSHANPAVAMGAVKVATAWLERLPAGHANRSAFLQRIGSALVTLARSPDSETVFIVCKNVSMLLEVHGALLTENIASFYIRFNDPTHVKSEKLKLLLRIMTPGTAANVVQELAEYVNEVDTVFILQVIDALARAAIRVESTAARCAALLLEVAKKRPEHFGAVINSAKNIVRKYPNMFPDLVAPLLKSPHLESVSEEDARVSLVWMVGEFCDLIDNGESLIASYVETFSDNETSVQLAILTAVVKIFLRAPAKMEHQMNSVLEKASHASSSPDLRDRAVVYYRLLSVGGLGLQKLQSIVHARKPPLDVARSASLSMTRGEIIQSLNTVSAIVAKPPRAFLPPYGVNIRTGDVEDDDDEPLPEVEALPDTPGAAANAGGSSGSAPASRAGSEPSKPPAAQPAQPPTKRVDPLDEIFGGPASAPAPAPSKQPEDPLASLFGPPAGVVASATVTAAPAPAWGPGSTPVTSTSQVPPAAATLPSRAPPKPQPSPFDDDPFAAVLTPAAAPPRAAAPTLPLVAENPANQADGGMIKWFADFSENAQGELVLQLQAINTSSAPLSDFDVLFNRNPFGLGPANPKAVTIAQSVSGTLGSWSVLAVQSSPHFAAGRPLIEIGIRPQGGHTAVRFSVPMPPSLFFSFSQPLPRGDFVQMWKGISEAGERTVPVPRELTTSIVDCSALAAKMRFLRGAVVHEMTTTASPPQHVVFGNFRTRTGVTLLFDVKVTSGAPSASSFTVKGPADVVSDYMPLVEGAVSRLASA